VIQITDSLSKLRRRTKGRLAKLIADLNLCQNKVKQASALIDEALLETKKGEDLMWYALALEAKAASLTMRKRL
jgi:hypothetical protein